MENKLKMVLAYFRALGGSFYSSVNFEYNTINDWDESFTQIYGNKRIKPPKVIIDILEELFKLYSKKFNLYNNYDIDEFWYLEITIHPKKNYIEFKSECEYEYDWNRNFKKDVDEYDIDNEIDMFKKEYGLIDELKIVFSGRWGEGTIKYLAIDYENINLSIDDNAWSIVDKIMTKEFDRYWNHDDGYTGEIKINGSQVIGNVQDIYRELGDTGMNLIVTPDNVLEK
jgi:hypothetical protein